MNDSPNTARKRSGSNVTRRRFLKSTLKAGGLLLMPQAIAAMCMKLSMPRILARQVPLLPRAPDQDVNLRHPVRLG